MNNKVGFLGLFIALMLLSSMFQAYESTALIEDCQSVSVIQEKVVDRFQPAYEEHSPISISGDKNLTEEAETESWDGIGTLEYPFIIEGYNITLSGSGICIALDNISLYVVVRDCLIGGGDTGIYLSNVTGFTSIGNSIYSNFRGMDIADCSYSNITSTIFTDNYYHIDLDDAVNIRIEGCQLNTGIHAIEAQYLENSWIVNNTISNLADGMLLGTYCGGNEIRQNSIFTVYFYAVRFSSNAQRNTVLLNYFQATLDDVADVSTDPENQFSHNYYSKFTSLDVNNDGIYDTAYLIPGSAGVSDYNPLRYKPFLPTWAQAPEDLEIELGSPCHYPLQIDSYPPIAHWLVNDTLHFTIDQNGVLLDRGNLVLGEYGLEVNATDLYGQSVTGVFKVTVVDTEYPVFVTTLQEVSFYYGEDVEIQVIAGDNSWIEEWTLSDTGNFSITWESFGELSVATIKSVGAPELGFYPLHLRVFDSSGLMAAMSFSVTIEQAPTEGAPLVWVMAPSGLAAAAIVIGLLSMLRTRKEK